MTFENSLSLWQRWWVRFFYLPQLSLLISFFSFCMKTQGAVHPNIYSSGCISSMWWSCFYHWSHFTHSMSGFPTSSLWFIQEPCLHSAEKSIQNRSCSRLSTLETSYHVIKSIATYISGTETKGKFIRSAPGVKTPSLESQKKHFNLPINVLMYICCCFCASHGSSFSKM